MSAFGFQVPVAVLVLGTIAGTTYGLLGIGLVLVFRSNRVVNFAHGEIGALGASVLGLAVVRWHLPYWVAFLLGLAVSGAVGGLAEVAIIRRLRRAPPLMSVVATLGVGEFLLLFTFASNNAVGQSRSYPQPSGLPSFSVGSLLVTRAYTGMLILAPILLGALWIFLRYSRFGIAIRAAAANPPAARAAGIFVGRMSTLSWIIAGMTAACAAALIFPTRGFVTAETLGPSLLLRALVPAVLARMTSLPIALVGGIGVGVVEQALLWNYPQGGLVETVLFIAIVVALLVQPRRHSRLDEQGSAWASVSPWTPLTVRARGIWAARNLGWLAAAASLAVILLVAAVGTNSSALVMASIVAIGLIGLSVGIVTGLAGQLSLGQFAIAGVGATVAYVTFGHTNNVLLGLIGAGLAGAVVSAVVGLPALRISGLMLAVTTLAFALAAQDWLFSQRWMLGEGRIIAVPGIGNIAFDTGKKVLLFTLVPFAVGLWMARNVWKGGLGRQLRAVRDNDDGARAFTVSPTRAKLRAFSIAGFLAGLGGAIYGYLLSAIAPNTFPVGSSVDVVAMSVVGGISLLAGPLLGALYIVGIPRYVPLDSAGLAATALGWLLLILYFPGGLAQLLAPARDRLLRWLGAVDVAEPTPADTVLRPELRVTDRSPAASGWLGDVPSSPDGGGGTPILEVSEVSKSFGGVAAVSEVSLSVHSGETLGVIGPNGAGKTTLFDLIGGFIRPDHGNIRFAGVPLGRATPQKRASMGLIRSFQDASLFPTLTVTETLQLSLERRFRTRLLPALVGFDRAQRRQARVAAELIDLMGLGAFADKRISDLSTGTRRVVELACIVALQPRVVLLDEPSSGIAQRESEALAELLVQLRSRLGLTMLLIEHDIPLLVSVSDRVVAMAAGRVIAEGTPDEVCRDPLVVDAYLGNSDATPHDLGLAGSSDTTAGDRP